MVEAHNQDSHLLAEAQLKRNQHNYPLKSYQDSIESWRRP